MTRTYTEIVTLQETVCKSCGVTHALPSKLLEGLQQTGGYYYCPNGHRWGWGDSEEDRLRKELKRIQTELIQVKDQLQASERETKRHKKRIANGVCPCCHRSFVQLQRHMQTQHPEYGREV
jgi:predicted  nucleic acid-binding Zn-ribbon protein